MLYLKTNIATCTFLKYAIIDRSHEEENKVKAEMIRCTSIKEVVGWIWRLRAEGVRIFILREPVSKESVDLETIEVRGVASSRVVILRLSCRALPDGFQDVRKRLIARRHIERKVMTFLKLRDFLPHLAALQINIASMFLEVADDQVFKEISGLYQQYVLSLRGLLNLFFDEDAHVQTMFRFAPRKLNLKPRL